MIVLLLVHSYITHHSLMGYANCVLLWILGVIIVHRHPLVALAIGIKAMCFWVPGATQSLPVDTTIAQGLRFPVMPLRTALLVISWHIIALPVSVWTCKAISVCLLVLRAMWASIKYVKHVLAIVRHVQICNPTALPVSLIKPHPFTCPIISVWLLVLPTLTQTPATASALPVRAHAKRALLELNVVHVCLGSSFLIIHVLPLADTGT